MTNLRAQIGVPADSAMIEIDGVQLAVARDGSGPAVVCLHAIGHGGRDFEAFTEAMRGQFEIIRIDWPAQGRSGPDPHHSASALRYAELLAGILSKLGIVRPIILGNSIGGAAAMIYASRAPVRALVLCDPGGLVAVNGFARAFCGCLASFFRAGARHARWYPTAFGLFYRLVLPKREAHAQRERIVAAAYETAPVLAEAWTSFTKPEADIRALAAGLKLPVWFAWARGDKVAPLRFCRPAICKMRYAHLSEFDAGHAAFLEQPHAFLKGFHHFINGLTD
ncbi:pimeloyl-ACP methyl ester carboxylesterase [Bradyrhizobium japonicum]